MAANIGHLPDLVGPDGNRLPSTGTGRKKAVVMRLVLNALYTGQTKKQKPNGYIDRQRLSYCK